MSRVLLLDDTDDLNIVGQLGSILAKLAKNGVKIVDGFIIPIDQKIEFGMSNEILTAFDRLSTERAILRSSINSQTYDTETLRDIYRDSLLGAISYLQQNNARRGHSAAVIVQRDLNAELAGTIHSINPVTMSPDEEMVEAHLWMNRTVLGGESEPDMLIINKRTGALSLESEEEAEICLGPKQISQLHAMVRKIEDRLKCDVSVDWAYDNGKLYVLRARPITNKTLERFK